MADDSKTAGPTPEVDASAVDAHEVDARKVEAQEVDVVVLGLGPGGEDVAGRLAEAGLRVVGIDQRLVGGECPYWGCIPSKMMLRAAGLIAEARRIPGLAGSVEVHPDYAPVARRIREEATDDWDDKVAVERLEIKGVEFVRGTGRLTGPRQVAVGERRFQPTRGVVIATGTEPNVPPIDGLAGTPYWTNRAAIEAESVPASLAVLGGGAVGLELAQVFARFGSAVTILEASSYLLAHEEPEAGELLAEVLPRDGITVRTGARVQAVRHDGDRFRVDFGAEPVVAEKLLVAIGRKPNLSGIGLETVGLDPASRALEVDDNLRVADGLWAVGDITGKGGFTHVAMYQSPIAVRSILGEAGPGGDYRALPRVTFTDPEIGAIGLTEQQARDAGHRIRVGKTQISSTSRGWIHAAGNDGFLKLIEDADSGLLLGATSAGPAGGEVLGALTVAVHGRVPVESLRHMMYAFPTLHRGIEDALKDLS